MNCPVCGKEFPGGLCPRCGFPEIHIVGDLETGLKRIQPEIDAYRAQFMGKIQLKLVIQYWQELDGAVVPEREERLLLGTAESLRTAIWQEQPFARIPELQELTLRVEISAGDDLREVTVSVPNLPQPSLQQIGAEMVNADHFRLLLRNDTEQSASQPVALFA